MNPFLTLNVSKTQKHVLNLSELVAYRLQENINVIEIVTSTVRDSFYIEPEKYQETVNQLSAKILALSFNMFTIDQNININLNYVHNLYNYGNQYTVQCKSSTGSVTYSINQQNYESLLRYLLENYE